MVVMKKNFAQGEASVLVKHPDGHEHQEDMKVGEVKEFGSEPCIVGLEIGATINTGDYSSMRFTVSLRMPSSVKDIDATYDEVKAWCDSKAEELVGQINSE